MHVMHLGPPAVRHATRSAGIGPVAWVTVHPPHADGTGTLRIESATDRTSRGKGTEAARVGRGDGHLELVIGAVAVAAVVLEGFVVAHRPLAGRLDRWLQDLVPGSHNSFYVDVTWLRYPWVVGIGAVAVAVAAATLTRDWLRAIALLAGPLLAIVVAEELIKPLVGRTLGGALTYPSGSTTGATALAAAAILATPARWRWWTGLVAGAYALWMTVAVVALRWHFPTDALAGALLGAGVVLICDGLARWVSRFRARGSAIPRAAHRSG